MQIGVSLLPPASFSGSSVDCVVVIDVLRATSVMATALAAGAKRIITCRDVEAALGLATEIQPRPLLCGERRCRRIDGFDLGNSPDEYRREIVAHRTLVLTTTNGTGAIAAADDAPVLITASFLNLSAVVLKLPTTARVHLICAGTDGQISREDVLLAGAIVASCRERGPIEFADDEARLALDSWELRFGTQTRARAAELANQLQQSRGGQNLTRVGYESDILACAQIDVVDIVPTRSTLEPTSFEPLTSPGLPG